jgi:TetR/AcrR family transcriptional regulator
MRKRDSQKSREDILQAAEIEFSEKGIYGTRIDAVAERANINKRMIYEYFGSKEQLYQAVLLAVYSRLGEAEIQVLGKRKTGTETIKEIIKLYFKFLQENPTYVNLLLWENLNQGRYIQDIDVGNVRNPSFEILKEVIDKGKEDGVFKAEIDTEQVILSLLIYTFSNFSNRYTLSKLLGKKLDDEINIEKRVEDLTAMVLNHILK